MYNHFIQKGIAALTFIVLLSSCGTTSRYQLSQDEAPRHLPEEVSDKNAVPAKTDYYPPSLKQYKVLGTRYQPLTNAMHYADEGLASWYGQKFHGHLTSNGETYDMFEMTAAHKFLPLPTYVRVVNLTNNKSVIVKVNDRGPFHDNRIIDLSYAAAKKLDMLQKGTARVRITSIVVDDEGWHHEAGKKSKPALPEPTTVSPPLQLEEIPETVSSVTGKTVVATKTPTNSTPNTATSPASHGKTTPINTVGYFIQVNASADKDKLSQQGQGLAMLLQTPFVTKQISGLFKLQLGPIVTESKARQLLLQVREQGFNNAFLILP